VRVYTVGMKNKYAFWVTVLLLGVFTAFFLWPYFTQVDLPDVNMPSFGSGTARARVTEIIEDGEIDLGRKCVGHSGSLRRFFLHLLDALEHLLSRTHEQEGLLRDVVVLPFDDLAEAFDRVGDLDVLSLDAGELLGDEEGLRQEPLYLPRARHAELVVFRQLVDAEDRDDVLQVLVALQHLLDLTRDVVVFVADDARVENA